MSGVTTAIDYFTTAALDSATTKRLRKAYTARDGTIDSVALDSLYAFLRKHDLLRPEGTTARDSLRHLLAVLRDDHNTALRDAASQPVVRLDLMRAMKWAVDPHPPADSILIRRDVFDVRPSPIVSQLIGGLTSKVFGGISPSPAPSASKDSTFEQSLEDLGPGSDSAKNPSHLFLAFGRIPIPGKTWGRLNLVPPSQKMLPKYEAVLANFVNGVDSRVGLSLGAGGILHGPASVKKSPTGIEIRLDTTVVRLSSTGPRADTVFVADTTFSYAVSQQGAEVNAYALLHVELWRRNPWPLRRNVVNHVFWFEAVSAFVGTCLWPSSIGSRIPFGFSLDHLWNSDFCLDGGVVLFKDKGPAQADPLNKEPAAQQRYPVFVAITLHL